MTDAVVVPPPGQPAPLPAPPPEPERPWRRLPLFMAISGVSMLLGAAATAAVLVLSGWGYQPDREYRVAVFFKEDATDAQKSAVRATLEKLPAEDGVRLETSNEAYEKFKALWKDDPQGMPEITPGALPESYRLTVVGHTFDCGPLRGLRRQPGVDDVSVAAPETKTQPAASIPC